MTKKTYKRKHSIEGLQTYSEGESIIINAVNSKEGTQGVETND